MKLRKNKPNNLRDYVETNKLNRKSAIFTRIENAKEVKFPQLTPSQVKSITLGSYQLKRANGYLIEHFNKEPKRWFEIAKEEIEGKSLIRAKLQSRHRNSKDYFIYITYTEEEVSEWYCSCFSGARTVGCCSHVAAIIFYFSTGAKIPHGIHKADYYLSQFRKTSLVVISNEDNDDDDVDDIDEEQVEEADD